MSDLTKDRFGKYNGKEMEYVLAALDSAEAKLRKKSWVNAFEEAFCEKMGTRYAIACNSGTSGLHAALYAAGVGPGDEVIGPALTVVMDAFATIHLGATPVFADINPDTYTIDPQDIAKKITPKTKAIIVVSLQGLSVDMDPIMALAKEKGIRVIEDSAQTLLGKYHGKFAGTIGDINVFSFEAKKHMTSGGEGGMIVTNDETLAIRARKFAGIGYKHMTATAGRTSLALSTVQDPDYERFDTIGLNYRMTEISAAVGLAQLERIDSIIDRRRQVAQYFSDAIQGCSSMVPQETPPGYAHSYYTFPVRYQGYPKTGISWKQFYNRYLEKGGDGFYGACKVPYLEPALNGFKINGTTLHPGMCPIAEKVQPEIMQFKTNYRDLDVAKRKAAVLKELLRECK